MQISKYSLKEYLFSFIFVIFLFYILILWKRGQYWYNRKIPGPRPKIFNGNLEPLFFGRQSAVLTLCDWTKEFGRIFGLRYGQTNVLVVSEPTIVHELLVSKFEHFHSRLIGPIAGNTEHMKWVHLFNAKGARWKRLRVIATPAFSVANLKKILPTIEDSIKAAIEILEEKSAQLHGGPFDVHKHFVEMAFDIIARIAMGQSESRQFQNADAQLAVRAIQRINNNWFDYYAWLFPWFGRNVLRHFVAWTSKWRNDPIGNFLAKIEKAVKLRKFQRANDGISEDHQKDFIDFFLDAESEEVDLESQQEGTFNSSQQKILRKNCLEEVVMQCFLFVLSGFDTTASSLSQVCHQLAWHPEVQMKLQEEIDAICLNEEITYEELLKLRYMESVIKETLRLSPRVITRVCEQETMLGQIQLDKGTGVQVDVLSLHRDKMVWGENASIFVPERWNSMPSGSPSYYAFGAGPRMCIGMRLALVENKLALCKLLRKFTIARCEKTERDIQFSGQVVLAPKSVIVKLQRR